MVSLGLNPYISSRSSTSRSASSSLGRRCSASREGTGTCQSAQRQRESGGSGNPVGDFLLLFGAIQVQDIKFKFKIKTQDSRPDIALRLGV